MQNFSREFNGIQRQQQYNDEEKTNIDKLEKKTNHISLVKTEVARKKRVSIKECEIFVIICFCSCN